MDRTRFGQNCTGQLVRLSSPDDYAFIPHALPKTLRFSDRLWPLLVDAMASVGRLDGIGRTLPNPLLLLTPLQKTEALKSSSLEGTYALAEDLLLFEMNPRAPRSARDQANDWQEVSNYGVALRNGYEALGTIPLCLRIIKDMHKHLLSGVRGRDKNPGEFRQHQVHIGSDRRYVPPPPQMLLECLGPMEQYMNTSTDLPPLIRAYVVHYQFEAIHPFLDGNGRVGRLLLALATYKWCSLYMPWVYMSAFFERYKDEYIDKLFRVSTDGDWDSWIEFCLRGTIAQADDSIRKCDALCQLQRDYANRLSGGSGSIRLRQIVDGLFSEPLVQISEVGKRMKVSYNTARDDIAALVKTKILRDIANYHPKTFYAPEIVRIAYLDDHGPKPSSDAEKTSPSAPSPPSIPQDG